MQKDRATVHAIAPEELQFLSKGTAEEWKDTLNITLT